MSRPWSREPPTEQERESLRDEWAAARGLTVAESTHACAEKIRSGRCDGGCGANLPGDDHTEVFLWRGRVALAVLQPYELRANTMCDLADLETDWPIDVLVSGGPSWHYPGAVLTIEVWNRDVRRAMDAEKRAAS